MSLSPIGKEVIAAPSSSPGSASHNKNSIDNGLYVGLATVSGSSMAIVETIADTALALTPYSNAGVSGLVILANACTAAGK